MYSSPRNSQKRLKNNDFEGAPKVRQHKKHPYTLVLGVFEVSEVILFSLQISLYNKNCKGYFFVYNFPPLFISNLKNSEISLQSNFVLIYQKRNE